MNFLYAWRGELYTLASIVSTWFAIKWIFKKNPTIYMLAGALVGLANEFMTEPLWTYHMQFYLWRDISPFTILGWGPLFAIIVLGSEALYKKLFPSSPVRNWKIILTDLMVGAPLMVAGETLGLRVLHIWEYNSVLQWHAMVPLINYPLAGLVSMAFFIMAMPAVVRYWAEKGA